MSKTFQAGTAGPTIELGGFSLRFEGPEHPSLAALEARMPAFWNLGETETQTLPRTQAQVQAQAQTQTQTPTQAEVALTLRVPDTAALGRLPHAERLVPRFSPEDAGVRVEVEAPGYRGSISPEGERAELRFDPERPVEDLEYFLRLIAAQRAFALGGLLLHAAALVSGEGARVFFGPSGSGKTTLAHNAAGRRVLNDDLVVLLPEPRGRSFRVHATPFSNATQVGPSGPASAPLASLHQLEHATINALRPIRPSLALAAAAACVPLISADPHRAHRVLQRVEALLATTPTGVLALTPDERFWTVLEPDSDSRSR